MYEVTRSHIPEYRILDSLFYFDFPSYPVGHPWVIIYDCLSKVRFGGERSERRGSLSPRNRYARHCIARLNTDNLRASWREGITQNHCHYTELHFPLLMSVNETHLRTLETKLRSSPSPNIILKEQKHSYFVCNVTICKKLFAWLRKIGIQLRTAMSFNEYCIFIFF
jgi:hypothetical protein